MRVSSSLAWLAVCALTATLHANVQDWTAHKDSFFSFETPPGWTAFPDPQKGWVHMMGTQGEDVVVWPVFLPGGPVALDVRAAQSIHRKLTESCPYHADWEPAQATGPNVVRARGRIGEMVAISAFAWRGSPRGVAGVFYIAGARATDFAKKSGDLERILRSVRLVGRAEGPTEYVQVSDPMEGGFTVELPVGWKAAGGTVRQGPDVPLAVVEAMSPDGKIRVAMGDAQSPVSFQEPGPGMVFPEGAMNGSSMVLRYLPGAYYCRWYVAMRAPAFCSDLQITDIRDLPELAPLAMKGDPSLAQRPFSIGAVSFRCREQGQWKAGYCQAMTARLMLPLPGQMGMWNVVTQVGYVAVPELADQAKAIMDHLGQSFQINPQWRMQEIQQAGIRSGIIHNTGTQIGDMMAASRKYKDAVESRIAQMRSDATLGVAHVVDPVTGRQMTVDSGSSFYWTNPQGKIVGTDVDTLPGVDFRKLMELPLR